MQIKWSEAGLSVRQPWAWALIHGGKDVENREWEYRPARRGRIYIHASGRMTGREYAAAAAYCAARGVQVPPAADLALGAIIGAVDLVDVVDAHPSAWFEGPLGLVLARPIAFATPVPATGALSFWPLPPDVAAACAAQLAAAETQQGADLAAWNAGQPLPGGAAQALTPLEELIRRTGGS